MIDSTDKQQALRELAVAEFYRRLDAAHNALDLLYTVSAYVGGEQHVKGAILLLVKVQREFSEKLNATIRETPDA